MGNVFTVQFSPDNALSCCLGCIARHTNYAWELEKNVGILQKDWEELKGIRKDIKERIKVEERDPHMKVRQEVAMWLSEVDAIEDAGVEKLIRDGRRESMNKCLWGCCPKSCITNYKLGKKVVKKQRKMAPLKRQKKFKDVTQRSSFPRADERPAELTLGLKSTFDEVCSSLKDDQVGTIGLYGMGGVGKTTLLTQVYNKSRNNFTDEDEEKNCSLSFNVVIWTVVSQNPNLTKVQDDIGNQTGLRIDSKEWKEKSQEDKAMEIFTVLKENKFVLFLDDIWERLDLNKLGVPIPNKNNKSKVVFTTRSKDVCGRMEARKLIQVKCLVWEEAWDLFQQKVGKETLQAHSEIPGLAIDVAKECAGLPLALITIGRAMAYKTTPEAWHLAIDLLKRNMEFSTIKDEVFPLLKFSYDSLPNDIVRSCFLYCSLYPEDWKISKEELIDKWICEGFLVKFKDDRKARNEAHDYICTLLHGSLLEEYSPEKVKMHDVIRDMAIWIACDCGATKKKFFVQAGVGLSETPNVADWEGAERVSLMNNKIRNLTETPYCPNLLTLFLNHNKFFVQANASLSETPNVAEWEGAEGVSLMNNKITNLTETLDCPDLLTLFLNNKKFFVQADASLSETPNVVDWEGAEGVTLMNNKIGNLTGTPDCPNLLTLFLNHNNDYKYSGEKFSIHFFRSMPNLRVLDLSGSWYLRGLPEEICELVSLQYLNLSNNTKLRRLPDRLQNLINLKCLKLAYTGIVEIPEGLLSSFKKLQILKLIQYSSPVSYLPKTFVEELESLKYLNDLAITITGHFELSDFSSSQKLMTITTSLDIDLVESIRYLDFSFLKRMMNLKSLDIIRCRELEEIIVGDGKTRLEIRNNVNCCHSLRSFYISDCYKIKNLTWLTFTPNIEEIKISGCSKMKALVVGKHWEWDEVADEEKGGRPINSNSIPFAKLTSLSLSFLPELESIYPSALSFPCLKNLEVIDCPKLKKLPFNSSSSCKSGITTEGQEKMVERVIRMGE